MTLVRPLGMILPGAEATISTLPTQAQTSARQNSAMMVHGDRAADRRRRRLDDLQRRRQEGELVVFAAASRRAETRPTLA